MTLTMQMVLRSFLEDPAKPRYGLELCESAGLQSGTVYPILTRLEHVGWVDSTWEDPEVHEAEGRPRRRYYTLSKDGLVEARQALAQISARQGKAIWARPQLRSEGGQG